MLFGVGGMVVRLKSCRDEIAFGGRADCWQVTVWSPTGGMRSTAGTGAGTGDSTRNGEESGCAGCGRSRLRE